MIALKTLTLDSDRTRAFAKVWELNGWIEMVVLPFAVVNLGYKRTKKKPRVGMVDKLLQGDKEIPCLGALVFSKREILVQTDYVKQWVKGAYGVEGRIANDLKETVHHELAHLIHRDVFRKEYVTREPLQHGPVWMIIFLRLCKELRVKPSIPYVKAYRQAYAEHLSLGSPGRDSKPPSKIPRLAL